MRWRVRVTVLELAVREGERWPAWYYGCGSRDLLGGVSYWYPVPLNYLVRLRWWLTWRWNRARGRSGVWIKHNGIGEAVSDAFQRGYQLGDLDGYKRGSRETLAQLERLSEHPGPVGGSPIEEAR